MFAIALLAATLSAEPQPATAREPLVRQASASVRILAGARITQGEAPADAIVRTSEIREPDGREMRTRLIEFQ